MGLGKSPLLVWKVKARANISDLSEISISVASSSLMEPSYALMTLDLVQICSPASSECLGAESVLELSLKVEDGEIVFYNDCCEVLIKGDFNLFVSLAPLAEGAHLLDSIPRLLKVILPAVDLLHHELIIPWL